MTDTAASKCKNRLRRHMREQREGLNPLLRQQLNNNINHHLIEWLCHRPERKIAAYWPIRGEADIRPAMHALAHSGREILLPRVDEHKRGRMSFAAWDPDQGAEKTNRYGIPEPTDAASVAPSSLDMVLTPLLAFCAIGGRLGAGAGYYDRAFARSQRSSQNRRHPLLIGIAYGFQQVDSLPMEPWDVPLDGIMTNLGLIIINSRIGGQHHKEYSEWPIG